MGEIKQIIMNPSAESVAGLGMSIAQGVVGGMALGGVYHFSAAGLAHTRGASIDPTLFTKHAVRGATTLGVVFGCYRGLKFCMDGASPSTPGLNAVGSGALAVSGAALSSPKMMQAVMQQQAAAAGRSLGLPGALFSFMLLGGAFFGTSETALSWTR